MGVYSEDSLEANVVMLRLVFIVAVAAAAPLEDTTEVALAKAEFQAAFDAAVAGEHAALAPVNNDVQAEQIPDEFLDVAAAKAEFLAAFESAAAGGLADLQAPAPVHEVPVAAPVPAAVPAPVYYPYNHVLPSYAGFGYGYAGYPFHGYNGYNGLPVFVK